MGAAQSIRNRVVSERQADEMLDTERQHFFAVLNAINSRPRGTAKPFGPVVIEPPKARGGPWWLMRAGADRHRHYGYHYPNLSALMADWSLVVTGFERDAAGCFYTTEIV